MHVVLCGPFPFDEQDWREADGLTMSVAILAEFLGEIPGTEVTVLTRSRRIARAVEASYRSARVVFVPDPLPEPDYFRSRRGLVGRFGRRLADLRPDIVHAHGEAPFIFAALKSLVPHVVTLHSIFAVQTRSQGTTAPLKLRIAYAFMRAWERRYLPRIRNLIAINTEIADAVRAASPTARIFPVRNAVSPRFFDLPAPRDSRSLLFVSQVSQRKGLHLLLEAFASLCDAFPDWTLRIVGSDRQDPPYVRGLLSRYARLVARGRVLFLGGMTRDEVLEEVARCAVFCLPSLYEASPLVIIEAMAAGKPVVASAVGDVGETISDRESGFLVPPGDVPALTRALREAMGDEALRARIGTNARAVAERLARPELAARRTLAVYSEILAGGGAEKGRSGS